MFKKGEVSTFKAEKRDRVERKYQTARKDKREVEKGNGKRKTKERQMQYQQQQKIRL